MPSRSRPRSVRVSICCEPPAALRSMSWKRRGPRAKNHHDQHAPFLGDAGEDAAYAV
jgi:hypothetical protein